MPCFSDELELSVSSRDIPQFPGIIQLITCVMSGLVRVAQKTKPKAKVYILLIYSGVQIIVREPDLKREKQCKIMKLLFIAHRFGPKFCIPEIPRYVLPRII